MGSDTAVPVSGNDRTESDRPGMRTDNAETMIFPSSHWHESVMQPDFSEWADLLAAGRRACRTHARLESLRASARRRAIETAQASKRRLCRKIRDAGVDLPAEVETTDRAAGSSLVVTGHQPVLFHGGLVWKYGWTEHFAREQSAVGLAITIDTDAGDPGAFCFPAPDPAAGGDQMRCESATWCATPDVFRYAVFRSSPERQSETDRVAAALRQTVSADQAERFLETAGIVQRLADAGLSAADAGVAARWQAGIGYVLPELCLSDLCRFPEAMSLTADIIRQAEEFADVYNAELHSWRRERSIKNPANPFPDLRCADDCQEVPLWLLDESVQQRFRVRVSRDASAAGVTLSADNGLSLSVPSNELESRLESLCARGLIFVPRGAFVSAMLRLLLADLFIHGTGGGRYDAFTDRLIAAWWNVTPPPFAVASASCYAFPDRRNRLQRLRNLESQLRDLRFNPQRYFGQGIFPESVESRLRQLMTNKKVALEQMQAMREQGRSGREIGKQIQQISNDMKRLVDDCFAEERLALEQMTPQTIEAIECRTYPWFLLPEEAMPCR